MPKYTYAVTITADDDADAESFKNEMDDVILVGTDADVEFIDSTVFAV